MKKLLVILFSIGLILGTHSIAKAATISSFEFIGHVTSSNLTENLPQISPFDVFTGSLMYTYDPSLADWNPDPDIGVYHPDLYSGILDYTLNFDSLIIQTGMVVDSIIIENYGYDSFWTWEALAITNWTSLGVDYAEVDFSFRDSTGSVFNDDSLPVIFDPNAFDDIQVDLSLWGIGCPSGSCGELSGDIDSITSYYTYTSIPEPATMFLLYSGLVGLAGLRRKFKRS